MRPAPAASAAPSDSSLPSCSRSTSSGALSSTTSYKPCGEEGGGGSSSTQSLPPSTVTDGKPSAMESAAVAAPLLIDGVAGEDARIAVIRFITSDPSQNLMVVEAWQECTDGAAAADSTSGGSSPSEIGIGILAPPLILMPCYYPAAVMLPPSFPDLRSSGSSDETTPSHSPSYPTHLIVGTCHLRLLPSLSNGGATKLALEAVRVARPHRGGGVGEAIVRAALAWGVGRGAVAAELTTHGSRERARAFYERLGFVATHAGMKMKLLTRETGCANK